jgi:hypothetical protein
MICTLVPILFGRTNQEKSDGRDKWRVQTKGENYTGCFLEGSEENNHLEDLRVQVRITLIWILKKCYGNALKGFICITVESKWLALVDAKNIRVP